MSRDEKVFQHDRDEKSFWGEQSFFLSFFCWTVNWQLADHFIYSSVLLHLLSKQRIGKSIRKCGRGGRELKWKSNFLTQLIEKRTSGNCRKNFKFHSLFAAPCAGCRHQKKSPSQKCKLHFFTFQKIDDSFQDSRLSSPSPPMAR